MFTLMFGIVAASGGSGGIALPLFDDSISAFGSAVRAWYKLHDTTTTATDETSNNSDGTYYGTYSQSDPGLVAQQSADDDCVDFNAGRVGLPTNTNLEEFAKSSGTDGNSQGYTIMAVVIMDHADAGKKTIVGKRETDTVITGHLYIDDNEKLAFTTRLYQSLAYVPTVQTNTTLVTGRKYHCCCRMGWTGNSVTAHKGMQIFLDGLEDGDAAIPWTSASSSNYPTTSYPWTIGDISATGWDLRGKIDEVVFFSGTPSNEDIYLIANRALHKFDYFTMIRSNSAFTQPVSWWRFRETSGTIYDHMGLHDLTNLSTGGTYNATGIPNSLDGSWTGAASNGFRKVVSNTYNYSSGAVEVWFKTTSQNTEYFFQTADESDIGCRILFFVETTGSIAYYVTQTPGNAFKSAATTYVCDGKWHQAVFQSDGSNAEIWIDGVKETTKETTWGTGVVGSWFDYATYTNRDDVTIGYGNNGGTDDEFFLGTITQVSVYDSILTKEEIRDRYRFGMGYHGLIEKLGYVAHWKLDEPGNTSTADEYGGNYDGTYTNIGSLHNDGATLQPAAEFNSATPSYVNVADNAALEITSGPITLAAWIKYTDASGSKYIITKDTHSGDNGTYDLQTNGDNKIRFTFYNGTANCYYDHTSTVDLKDAWHHVAFTHVWGDDTSSKIYIDGVEQTGGAWTGGGGTGTPTGSTRPLRIGERSDTTTSNSFGGLIQHVTVSDRYYSALEIKNLYLQTALSTVPSAGVYEPTDLIHSIDWENDGSGSSAALDVTYSSTWGRVTNWNSNNGFNYTDNSGDKYVQWNQYNGLYYQKKAIYGTNIRVSADIEYVTASAWVDAGIAFNIPDPTGSTDYCGFSFGYRHYNPGTVQRYYRIMEMTGTTTRTERATSVNFGPTDIWTGNTFTFMVEIRNGVIYGYVDDVFYCKYDASATLVGAPTYAGIVSPSAGYSGSSIKIRNFKSEYIT